MMMSSQNTNSLASNEVAACISRLTLNFPSPDCFVKDDNEKKAYQGNLFKRLDTVKRHSELVDLIKRDVLVYGVLVFDNGSDADDETTVNFAHKSMLEFLSGLTVSQLLMGHDSSSYKCASKIEKAIRLDTIESLVVTEDSQNMCLLKCVQAVQESDVYRGNGADFVRALSQMIFFKRNVKIGKFFAPLCIKFLTNLGRKRRMIFRIIGLPMTIIKAAALSDIPEKNRPSYPSLAQILKNTFGFIIAGFLFGTGLFAIINSWLNDDVSSDAALDGLILGYPSELVYLYLLSFFFIFLGTSIIYESLNRIKMHFIDVKLNFFFRCLEINSTPIEDIKRVLGKKVAGGYEQEYLSD